MSTEKRLAEARECILRAEKHLKTSIWKLKTTPEYDMAAYEYDRAAVCFKNAEKLNECMEMYLKSAECHHNTGNNFHEGKSKENAALIAKEAGNLDKSTQLFEESALLYLEANSFDTAAMTIDKAAKLLEPIDTQKAIEVYTKGLEIVRDADRSKMAVGFMQRLIGLYLREKDLAGALKISDQLIDRCKENEDYGKVGQIALGMVIIELVRGDSVAAQKALPHLLDVTGHSFAQEMSAAQSLIRCYDDGDDDSLKLALKNGVIRSMDNAYLRLIKELHAPQNAGGAVGGGGDDDDEDLR